jgi:hypothetical protein
MIHAVGILIGKNTKKKKDCFLVGCKARGLPKGGYGCVLAIKTKIGEKSASCKLWPKAILFGRYLIVRYLGDPAIQNIDQIISPQYFAVRLA